MPVTPACPNMHGAPMHVFCDHIPNSLLCFPGGRSLTEALATGHLVHTMLMVCSSCMRCLWYVCSLECVLTDVSGPWRG